MLFKENRLANKSVPSNNKEAQRKRDESLHSTESENKMEGVYQAASSRRYISITWVGERPAPVIPSSPCPHPYSQTSAPAKLSSHVRVWWPSPSEWVIEVRAQLLVEEGLIAMVAVRLSWFDLPLLSRAWTTALDTNIPHSAYPTAGTPLSVHMTCVRSLSLFNSTVHLSKAVPIRAVTIHRF